MERIEIASGIAPVCRVGLGTWAAGGWMWGGSDESDAIETVVSALDMGVNLVDTAPVYGFGAAEDIVGKALRRRGKRDEAVIATKVGLAWENSSRPVRDARAQRIEKEIEDSLRRLGVEAIDLYQVHWPDPKTPIEETAQAMKKLLDAGKIRAVGVSNFSCEEMQAFAAVCPIATSQPPYNIFERGMETTILPYCKAHGIKMLGYGALCRGLLSGKITAESRFHGDDLRNGDPKFLEPRLSQYLAAVRRLDDLARGRFGKTVLELAVRWVLDRGVEVALWGARRPHQLHGMEGVFGWKLGQEEMEAIDKILAEEIQDPVGPEFMAPGVRQD